MVVNIYCIKDINNLKYVGSTKKKINDRFSGHLYDKKINRGYCSSKLLDLDNCKIYLLETCEESNRKEREQYWIDNTACVNIQNTTFDRKEYIKQYREENKEQIKEYKKQYREENKEQMKEYHKQYDYYRYYYQNSWGGDKRYNNNLLQIDINIFEL